MIATKKPIRIDRDPVFVLQPDPDFSGKTGPRFSRLNRILPAIFYFRKVPVPAAGIAGRGMTVPSRRK